MKYQYVIWDWNGTLIDDVHAALAAVNDMLLRRGRQPISLDDYYSYLEMPIINFYKHLYDLEKESFPELAKEFQKDYEIHSREANLMLHGEYILKILSESNVHQIVISSSAQKQIQEQIVRFGVQDYFDAILGADDIYSVGKTERAKAFFTSHDIDPKTAVLIGDTKHDFEVSAAINCDCILVSMGHQSKEDLLSCGTTVVDTLSEILDHIR